MCCVSWRRARVGYLKMMCHNVTMSQKSANQRPEFLKRPFGSLKRPIGMLKRPFGSNKGLTQFFIIIFPIQYFWNY